MRGHIENRRTNRARLVVGALALAAALVGCSADEVTGPTSNQVVAPPPSNSASTTWNITVTAAPDSFDIAAGSGFSQIEVRARRNDNGASVAPGTTALLSTTGGSLTGNDGSAGDSIPITFDAGGVARATLTTGTFANASTIIVRGQIESSFGSDQIQMVEVPTQAFLLSGVSPDFGPPSGGTRVSISGQGFVEPLRVTFVVNGAEILAENVSVSSGTRISATSPQIDLAAGQNAAATIQVENAFSENGVATGTDSLVGAFTYTRSNVGPQTVKVISVTPTSGPNEGGTQVTIIGEGFPQNAQVFFSNTALVEATVLEATPNRIEAITPSATGQNSSNANAFVSVIVRDPASGQQATLPNGYQYGTPGGSMFISAVGPTQDEYLGGALVTVFGQGFDEPVALEAGGVGQQIISVTGTEIVFRAVPIAIGCANQSGTVSVTNIETAEGATGPNFTYVPINPSIISVSPGLGSAGGGQGIIINGIRSVPGVGFDNPVRVLINGRPASNATVTNGDVNGVGSLISAITPAFTGTFTFTTDGCPAGQARPVPTPVSVQVINLDTGCTETLAEAYLYDPPDPGCVGQTLITANITFTAAGLTVSFQSNSTFANAWDWDFGDGATSTLENPTHTYPAAGTYTVNLVASDGIGGVATDSESVTVPPP